jgi:hypothetical protein
MRNTADRLQRADMGIDRARAFDGSGDAAQCRVSRHQRKTSNE